MKPIRLLASVMAAATGIIGVTVGYLSPAPEGNQLLIAVLGVLLVVDSLGCLFGANFAFAGSAVLSALLEVSALVGWGGVYSGLEWLVLALALVNIALSVVALRSTSVISEQSNPMNLPVFG